MSRTWKQILVATVTSVLVGMAAGVSTAKTANQIQPDSDNAHYWQYRGEPVLLLGASDEDNLFQWAGDARRSDLIDHLDAMQTAGANYLRNTMNDGGSEDVSPFYRRDDGKFDLSRWNDEYWERLEFFLDETAKRDIVVQLTFWDAWNFIDFEDRKQWQNHAYNPANNVNYTREQTDLPSRWSDHPSSKDHPILMTVPALNDDAKVLAFQNKYVEKVLSTTFQYDHVLYNVQNEAANPLEWSDYWADFVHERAAEENETIYLTSMRDEWDVTASVHRHVLEHPGRYQYFDASQNTWMIREHGDGGAQTGYDHLMDVRSQIDSGQMRPINVVKLYGADGGGAEIGTEQAIHTFWMHLFAGVAGVRFHRPSYGLGGSPEAYDQIRGVRTLLDRIEIFSMKPAPELLSDRSSDEAYALAEPGVQYAVYFREGGDVKLDISAVDEPTVEIEWLDLGDQSWGATEVGRGDSTSLAPPRSEEAAVAIVHPDACPDDPDKRTPGVCGCGDSDEDSDDDGLADCTDECPERPAETDTGCPDAEPSDTGVTTPDTGDEREDSTTDTTRSELDAGRTGDRTGDGTPTADGPSATATDGRGGCGCEAGAPDVPSGDALLALCVLAGLASRRRRDRRRR